jgi:hypothetical protein
MNARLAKPVQHDLVYSLGVLGIGKYRWKYRSLQALSGATISRAAGIAVVAAQKHCITAPLPRNEGKRTPQAGIKHLWAKRCR